jgi:hypothetical protein
MTEIGCDQCNHTGFLPVPGDDSRVQQCICSYARALKAHLGPEIAAAPIILKSPLYVAGGKGEPAKIDRTQDNLFIKVYWSDLLPHLKWALTCKGPMFRYRIVTDERLKTVYLGSEDYRARAKSKRDDITTFNSVGDLIGPEYDMVIVRLGFLGYKNVAMPGILKEALMLRESALKPTWLIEEPASIYGFGHFSYSEDTAAYIDRLFEVINLVDEKRTPEAPRGVEPVEDVTMEDDEPRPQIVQPPQPRFTSPKIDPVEFAVPEGSGRKSGWKKKGGGGPV